MPHNFLIYRVYLFREFIPFMEASTVAHSLFTKGTTTKNFKFTHDQLNILPCIYGTLCNISCLCIARRDLFLEPWAPGQLEKLISPLKFSIEFFSHELSTATLEGHKFSNDLNGFQCPILGPGARSNQSRATQNYQMKLIDVLFCIRQIYQANQFFLECTGPKSAVPEDLKKAMQKLHSEVFVAEKLAKMMLPCSKFITLSCQGKYPPVGMDSWLTFFGIFRHSYGHIAYGLSEPDDDQKDEKVPRLEALTTLEIIIMGYAPQILRSSFKEIPRILKTDDDEAVVMAFEWISSWLTLLDISIMIEDMSGVSPAKLRKVTKELMSKEVQEVILATRTECEDYYKQASEGTVTRMAALMAITGLDLFQFDRTVARGVRPVQQIVHQMTIAIGSYTEFAQEVLQVQENPALKGIFEAETKYLSPMWLIYISIGMRIVLVAEMVVDTSCRTIRQQLAESNFPVVVLDFVAALAAAHAVLSPLRHKFNDPIVNHGNLRMFIYPVVGFPVITAKIVTFLLNIQSLELPHPPGSPAFEERIRAATAATYATCKDALIHLAMPREEIKKSYAHGVAEHCHLAKEEAIITQLFFPTQFSLGIASKYLLEDSIGHYVESALRCFYKYAM